jgi:hypothetical protein
MAKNTVDNNFFYEIAFEFLSRAKRSYFLSPLEIDLIKKWEEKGIPLTIIKKSLNKGFEKAGRKKTLLYFKKIVEKEFRAKGDKLIAKQSENNDKKTEEADKQIDLIESEYFRKKYKQFNLKDSTYGEKEEFDDTIDKEIIALFFNENIDKTEEEWNKKFQYIKVGQKEKIRLIEKYFIMKKREELNLFYFSYL